MSGVLGSIFSGLRFGLGLLPIVLQAVVAVEQAFTGQRGQGAAKSEAVHQLVAPDLPKEQVQPIIDHVVGVMNQVGHAAFVAKVAVGAVAETAQAVVGQVAEAAAAVSSIAQAVPAAVSSSLDPVTGAHAGQCDAKGFVQ
jgi:ATP/maltotriose-dependent transcriptional regulator MalT